MKKKRNVISTAILVVLLLVGLSVMLYPTVSDWWNSRVQTRAIATYNQSVEQMDTGDKERLLMEAGFCKFNTGKPCQRAFMLYHPQ